MANIFPALRCCQVHGKVSRLRCTQAKRSKGETFIKHFRPFLFINCMPDGNRPAPVPVPLRFYQVLISIHPSSWVSVSVCVLLPHFNIISFEPAASSCRTERCLMKFSHKFLGNLTVGLLHNWWAATPPRCGDTFDKSQHSDKLQLGLEEGTSPPLPHRLLLIFCHSFFLGPAKC